MTTLEINENAKEPHEYFKILKDSTLQVKEEDLQAGLNVIAEHILKAKHIGQKAFLRRLAFAGGVLLKEQILYHSGIRDYVYIDKIKNYLDTVKPENSVKIIELDRFPRAIPWEAMEKIAAAQALNLFTDFIIVFTDFTREDYQTPEDKKKIERNRDPIVFGFFKDDKTGQKHDRFYVIADWEDEYCDLTFDKLIKKMQEKHIANAAGKIGQDAKYIQSLIGKTLKATDDEKEIINKKFWERLKGG